MKRKKIKISFPWLRMAEFYTMEAGTTKSEELAWLQWNLYPPLNLHIMM